MALAKYLNANASPALTKRPQFFRVLIPNPFVKLHIPQNFMKHLEGNRHKKATLLSPSGKFWHIDLQQEGENLYLDGNWCSFAKSHDLRTGYFVVFRYEGNMVFTVKVFDETCCLKEYELVSSSNKNPGCTSSTSNDSSEVECLTLSQSSEHQDEVQCNSKPSSKKRKSADIVRERTSPATPPLKEPKRTSPESATLPIKKIQKTFPSLTALPQFEKTVRPFSSKYMSFPKKFCIQSGLVSRRGIILKNLKGKCYPVRLYNRPTEVRVGKGWREFASETGIKDGDTCLFKLVAKSTMLVSLKNMQGEIEAQFEKIVRPFNLGLGYFTIPRSFCLEYGLVSKRNITLVDSDSKKWQVRFLIQKDKAKFQKGWCKFSNAHELQVGDKCKFMLVEENTFRVIVEKQKESVA